MKKILHTLVIVSAMGFLGIVLPGCGNSPDGDGQKPVDGDYGRMSGLYGPSGDGKSRRMTNANPNIDPSQKRMGNTNPDIDPSQKRMTNN